MNGSGEDYREWRRRDVLDTAGDKIGTVEDIYYDDATGKPQWLLVKTGLFGTKKTLVPAYDIGLQGDELTVPFTEERVKAAPKFDPDEMLTDEQERNFYSYYDLEYVASIEAVRWDPTSGLSEEEVRGRLGRPSQCLRLGQTIMMEPAAQDDEEA
jgi:sporulation protein YlmC with PRC-barrel domain